MQTLERLRRIRRATLLGGDLIAIWIGLATTLVLRQPTLVHARVFASFVPLLGPWLMILYLAGLYEYRSIRDFTSLIRALLLSWTACLIVGSLYFYAIGPYLQLSPKTHLFILLTEAHVAILCWRRAALATTGLKVLDLRVAILADDTQRKGWEALVPEPMADWLAPTPSAPEDTELLVADPEWFKRNPRLAHDALKKALERRIPIISLDEFYESLFGKVSPQRATDLGWLLTHVLPRSGSPYFNLKRAIDLTIAIPLLIVFTPTLLLIGGLIWVADGHNPIFRQRRVGHLGRPFTLLKLRSMPPGADAIGPFPLNRTDIRTTTIGRLVRRLRIDELPQLINVIRGEMSLVGPRPEWIKEVEILETSIPTYHLRHLVPPGVTGWAQVYFRATNNIAESVEKHHYDLYYLKHFSLALDASILLKTIKRVIVSDSTVSARPFPHSPESNNQNSNMLDSRSLIGRQ